MCKYVENDFGTNIKNTVLKALADVLNFLKNGKSQVQNIYITKK